MRLTWAVAGVVMLTAVVGVRAQAPPASQGTVSREEYDRLKQEQDSMRKEIDDLKRALSEKAAAPAPVAPVPAPAVAPTPAPAATNAPTGEDFDDLQKQVKGLKEEIQHVSPGTSKLFIAGDMNVGFTLQRGTQSTFSGGFAPLILFEPTDRILIEAAADIGVDTDPENNSSTSFDLTIANISYLVNDHLAVGAGLFVVPFGVYHNHFDPPWINKFPDDPLPFGEHQST